MGLPAFFLFHARLIAVSESNAFITSFHIDWTCVTCTLQLQCGAFLYQEGTRCVWLWSLNLVQYTNFSMHQAREKDLISDCPTLQFADYAILILDALMYTLFPRCNVLYLAHLFSLAIFSWIPVSLLLVQVVFGLWTHSIKSCKVWPYYFLVIE